MVAVSETRREYSCQIRFPIGSEWDKSVDVECYAERNEWDERCSKDCSWTIRKTGGRLASGEREETQKKVQKSSARNQQSKERETRQKTVGGAKQGNEG